MDSLGVMFGEMPVMNVPLMNVPLMNVPLMNVPAGDGSADNISEGESFGGILGQMMSFGGNVENENASEADAVIPEISDEADVMADLKSVISSAAENALKNLVFRYAEAKSSDGEAGLPYSGFKDILSSADSSMTAQLAAVSLEMYTSLFGDTRDKDKAAGDIFTEVLGGIIPLSDKKENEDIFPADNLSAALIGGLAVLPQPMADISAEAAGDTVTDEQFIEAIKHFDDDMAEEFVREFASAANEETEQRSAVDSSFGKYLNEERNSFLQRIFDKSFSDNVKIIRKAISDGTLSEIRVSENNASVTNREIKAIYPIFRNDSERRVPEIPRIILPGLEKASITPQTETQADSFTQSDTSAVTAAVGEQPQSGADVQTTENAVFAEGISLIRGRTASEEDSLETAAVIVNDSGEVISEKNGNYTESKSNDYTEGNINSGRISEENVPLKDNAAVRAALQKVDAFAGRTVDDISAEDNKISSAKRASDSFLGRNSDKNDDVPANTAVGTENAPAGSVIMNQLPADKTEPEVLRTVSVQTAEQIAERLHEADNGGAKEIIVSLNPRELGRIAVKITRSESGEISVMMTAQNQAVSKLIDENKGVLAAALADRGAEVHDIRVVDPAEAGQMMSFDMSGGQNNMLFGQHSASAHRRGTGSPNTENDGLTIDEEALEPIYIPKEAKLWTTA